MEGGGDVAPPDQGSGGEFPGTISEASAVLELEMRFGRSSGRTSLPPTTATSDPKERLKGGMKGRMLVVN